MKGMIFTEFMEMVEATWSLDRVDAIIIRSQVPSGGAYTSVGTYPHEEMIALVAALSQETGIAVPDLVRTFGRHLFGRFALGYPRFLQGMTCTFQFLAGIEDVIHAEVRKLYPDAELPTFEVERGDNSLTLTYFSDHPFADLAHGLIEGCVAHFGEAIEVQREAVTGLAGAQARFTLTSKD
ncbi:MAG: heme NO-binding domain-containing protein [Pseudomonadota bacterium]|nr:heme NO-binding domain-containing protein [Pseudomonadota bacterium]